LAENFALEALNSASANSLFHGRNTGSKAKYFAKSAVFALTRSTRFSVERVWRASPSRSDQLQPSAALGAERLTHIGSQKSRPSRSLR